MSHWQPLGPRRMASGHPGRLQLSGRLIGSQGEVGDGLQRVLGPLRIIPAMPLISGLHSTWNSKRSFLSPPMPTTQPISFVTTTLRGRPDSNGKTESPYTWQDWLEDLSWKKISLLSLWISNEQWIREIFAPWDSNIAVAANCGKSGRISRSGSLAADVESQFTRGRRRDFIFRKLE